MADCPANVKPGELWDDMSPAERHSRSRAFRLREQANDKRARAKALIERAEELDRQATASEALADSLAR